MSTKKPDIDIPLEAPLAPDGSGSAAAPPAAQVRRTIEPMRFFEADLDGPPLELERPTPRALKTNSEDPPARRALSEMGVRPESGLSLERPSPRAPRPLASVEPVTGAAPSPFVTHRSSAEHFSAPPTVTFYSPIALVLLLAAGAGLCFLGVTQLPVVSDLLGTRHTFLGVQGCVMALFLGISALLASVRYHASRGEGDIDWMSPRRLALVGAVPVSLILLLSMTHRGTPAATSPTPSDESEAVLYQPAFRRAFVEQLKVQSRDATVDVPDEEGAAAGTPGTLLRFRTEECTQAFVDGLAHDNSFRTGLRKSGLRRVGCIGVAPDRRSAFEATSW